MNSPTPTSLNDPTPNPQKIHFSALALHLYMHLVHTNLDELVGYLCASVQLENEIVTDNLRFSMIIQIKNYPFTITSN